LGDQEWTTTQISLDRLQVDSADDGDTQHLRRLAMESTIRPSSADEVLDLMDASFHSAALGAALELGLFWLLDAQPLEAEQVAQELTIPLKRCHYWLQLLAQIGLIEEGPGGYQVSPTARASILEAYSRETWELLAQEARDRLPGLRDLSTSLREPDSAWETLRLTPRMYLAEMEQDPEVARRFTRMLYEIHLPLAEELAELLDLSGVEKLMDLGGGSGVVSLALLRRYPELNATVVDLTNVCWSGREIAAESSLAERITYHPANFLQDPLPTGFDLALECDVNVYSEPLFRKVRRSLRRGGRFVIVDEFAPTEEVAPPSRLHWAFEGSMIDPQFSFPTSATVMAFLENAGFQILSEHSLPPLSSAAARFDRDLTVIDARTD
jgi:SAM-dependent methyltransferase